VRTLYHGGRPPDAGLRGADCRGIRILAHILQPDEVLIGIEDNKPQAISMLRAVLCDAHGISLRVIPTKYPPVAPSS
jgi:Na+-translocating ferredoxin:NAD+ oxidoreductase RnfC subunit